MNGDKRFDAFGPLLVLSLALFLWFGFQCLSLIDERQQLAAMQERQQPVLENAQKIRVALDKLATDTGKLAEKGNPRAKALMDELNRRGIELGSGKTPDLNPEAKK